MRETSEFVDRVKKANRSTGRKCIRKHKGTFQVTKGEQGEDEAEAIC